MGRGSGGSGRGGGREGGQEAGIKTSSEVLLIDVSTVFTVEETMNDEFTSFILRLFGTFVNATVPNSSPKLFHFLENILIPVQEVFESDEKICPEVDILRHFWIDVLSAHRVTLCCEEKGDLRCPNNCYAQAYIPPQPNNPNYDHATEISDVPLILWNVDWRDGARYDLKYAQEKKGLDIRVLNPATPPLSFHAGFYLNKLLHEFMHTLTAKMLDYLSSFNTSGERLTCTPVGVGSKIDAYIENRQLKTKVLGDMMGYCLQEHLLGNGFRMKMGRAFRGTWKPNDIVYEKIVTEDIVSSTVDASDAGIMDEKVEGTESSASLLTKRPTESSVVATSFETPGKGTEQALKKRRVESVKIRQDYYIWKDSAESLEYVENLRIVILKCLENPDLDGKVMHDAWKVPLENVELDANRSDEKTSAVVPLNDLQRRNAECEVGGILLGEPTLDFAVAEDEAAAPDIEGMKDQHTWVI